MKLQAALPRPVSAPPAGQEVFCFLDSVTCVSNTVPHYENEAL